MPTDALIDSPVDLDVQPYLASATESAHIDSPGSEKSLDLQTKSTDLAYNDEKTETGEPDVVIVSGQDVSTHLLSLRDDGDSPLTFRSILLATGLSAFAAVMYQIYLVSE
jgi:hypothetical protein